MTNKNCSQRQPPTCRSRTNSSSTFSIMHCATDSSKIFSVGSELLCETQTHFLSRLNASSLPLYLLVRVRVRQVKRFMQDGTFAKASLQTYSDLVWTTTVSEHTTQRKTGRHKGMPKDLLGDGQVGNTLLKNFLSKTTMVVTISISPTSDVVQTW